MNTGTRPERERLVDIHHGCEVEDLPVDGFVTEIVWGEDLEGVVCIGVVIEGVV